MIESNSRSLAAAGQGFKIDIHTHIMPEHIPNWFQKFGYGDFIRLEHHRPCCARMIKGDKVFREIEQNAWEPAVRMTEMDMTEVGVQVLSTIPVLFNYFAKPEHTLETAALSFPQLRL